MHNSHTTTAGSSCYKPLNTNEVTQLFCSLPDYKDTQEVKNSCCKLISVTTFHILSTSKSFAQNSNNTGSLKTTVEFKQETMPLHSSNPTVNTAASSITVRQPIQVTAVFS